MLPSRQRRSSTTALAGDVSSSTSVLLGLPDVPETGGATSAKQATGKKRAEPEPDSDQDSEDSAGSSSDSSSESGGGGGDSSSVVASMIDQSDLAEELELIGVKDDFFSADALLDKKRGRDDAKKSAKKRSDADSANGRKKPAREAGKATEEKPEKKKKPEKKPAAVAAPKKKTDKSKTKSSSSATDNGSKGEAAGSAPPAAKKAASDSSGAAKSAGGESKAKSKAKPATAEEKPPKTAEEKKQAIAKTKEDNKKNTDAVAAYLKENGRKDTSTMVRNVLDVIDGKKQPLEIRHSNAHIRGILRSKNKLPAPKPADDKAAGYVKMLEGIRLHGTIQNLTAKEYNSLEAYLRTLREKMMEYVACMGQMGGKTVLFTTDPSTGNMIYSSSVTARVFMDKMTVDTALKILRAIQAKGRAVLGPAGPDSSALSPCLTGTLLEKRQAQVQLKLDNEAIAAGKKAAKRAAVKTCKFTTPEGLTPAQALAEATSFMNKQTYLDDMRRDLVQVKLQNCTVAALMGYTMDLAGKGFEFGDFKDLALPLKEGQAVASAAFEPVQAAAGEERGDGDDDASMDVGSNQAGDEVAKTAAPKRKKQKTADRG